MAEQGGRLKVRHRLKLTIENEVDNPKERAAIDLVISSIHSSIHEALKKMPGKLGSIKIKLLDVAISRPGGWDVIGKEKEDDDDS